MPKKNYSLDEQVVDLLQKLLVIELAKESIPQNDIARIVGIHITKVNSILKYFKSNKRR
jgi:hypothetical protein